jgi:hypothetical protein
MTGEKILFDNKENLYRIGPNTQVIDRYSEIGQSLNSFECLDSFVQLRRNAQGGGLALEMMLFNKDIIHDIVITNINIIFVSVRIKSITNIKFITAVNQQPNIINQLPYETITLHLSTDINVILNYSTDGKRFNEFMRIKKTLTNLISQ